MGGPPPTPDVCTIPECGGVVHARGWCAMHYQRWLRLGDSLGPVRSYRGSTGLLFFDLRGFARWKGATAVIWVEGCAACITTAGGDRPIPNETGNPLWGELAPGSTTLALLCPLFFRPTRAARHPGSLRCLIARGFRCLFGDPLDHSRFGQDLAVRTLEVFRPFGISRNFRRTNWLLLHRRSFLTLWASLPETSSPQHQA